MRTGSWHKRRTIRRLAVIAATLCLLDITPPPEVTSSAPPPEVGAEDLSGADADVADDDPRLTLSEAPRVERQTLEALLASGQWVRRAIAVMRLERYRGEEVEGILQGLLEDKDWRVRCFAAAGLGRRYVELPAETFDEEENPRVLRAALRHRLPVDRQRLKIGIKNLARRSDLADRLLAAELAAAAAIPPPEVPEEDTGMAPGGQEKDPGAGASSSGGDELMEDAREWVRQVIFRMSRAEAGRFSPRLAALTGGPDLRTPFRWHRWMREHRHTYELQGAHAIPERDLMEGFIPSNPLSELSPEAFSGLESYFRELGERELDLGIAIDCTASMSGELRQVQAGMDDLALFVGSVVEDLRIGLVAYRDRRADRTPAEGVPLTRDAALLRQKLWTLEAEGGGDGPESVHDALRAAYDQLGWDPSRTMVLILIGDARPHPGTGARCELRARQAYDHGLVTHTIRAEDREVDHFETIAQEGGGRCIGLMEDASLILEIAGLSLGGRFDEELRAFFEAYLALCR